MLSRASALASSATRAHVSLRWLIRVRWGAAIGQLFVVLWARFGLGLLVPLAPLFALSGFAALTNIVAARWLARRESAPPRVVGTLLAIDTLLLTAALAFTGGALNPFSVVYLVYITLAAVVLSARWTWSLTVLAACSYGLLFLGALQTVPGSSHHPPAHGLPTVPAPMDMSSHLQGMWWAFVLAASLTAYFVVKLASALELRDRELARMREQAARSERLASLTTLAAGAAHELSTPLATIAVVTREMERALEQRRDAATTDASAHAVLLSAATDVHASSSGPTPTPTPTLTPASASTSTPTSASTATPAHALPPASTHMLSPSPPSPPAATPPAFDDSRLLADARLIRDELHRCRAILDRMAAQAGEPVGEMPTAVCVRDLVADALRALPADEAARVEVVGAEAMAFVTVPGRGVVTALVSLLRNALDASDDRTRPITFTADADRDTVRLVVRDRGAGMTPDVLARVGEPFFSTKPAGAGMGLGLFLTRALAERLGGALRLESTPGQGTAATLELPVRNDAGARAPRIAAVRSDNRDSSNRASFNGDSSNREACERDASDRDPSDRDPSDRESFARPGASRIASPSAPVPPSAPAPTPSPGTRA